ncbi:hypothetical protein [Streptomyces sp. NPDC058623]|uniref:hypothetical protein n=1 Tax=Streptomyces sp. NPDC058623 TaxID=3346563 RepID=UPI00365F2258
MCGDRPRARASGEPCAPAGCTGAAPTPKSTADAAPTPPPVVTRPTEVEVSMPGRAAPADPKVGIARVEVDRHQGVSSELTG